METLETVPPLPPEPARRLFLRQAGVALAGSLLPFATPASDAAPDSSLPENDVRHYGIVPNSAPAASSNTAKLKALVSPAGSFSGTLLFTNTTGADVYYFNDLIAFHDGIHLDLQGSTLNFTKTGEKRDSASGFIHALRNFTIENGTLVTRYQFTAGYNTGSALAFGGRGNDTAFFPGLYDQTQPAPLGNITVRNLRIRAGASGGNARGIFMLGGFDGVLFDTVSIDGQNQLVQGVYYEFGWATNEPAEIDRHSSHARNFRVHNLSVSNVRDEGFGANGAFEVIIDGLRVSNCGSGCLFGPGESLYYRPWVPGGARARPSVSVQHMTGEGLSVIGVGVTGASKISGSYLDHPPAHDNPLRLGADQQADLIDFALENFTLSGGPRNYGVLTSAASTRIRDGSIQGFQRGIVTTQECTQFLIDGVKIFDSMSFGIQLGLGITVHTPPRLATGTIRNCVIAGSGQGGKCAGIAVATTRSCLIEGCRFGYANDMDGKGESTQTQAVTVAADASGVTCRNNLVAATTDNTVAYALAGGGGRNCKIEGARGVQTHSGPWG